MIIFIYGFDRLIIQILFEVYFDDEGKLFINL
jgi:hypothetical protein